MKHLSLFVKFIKHGTSIAWGMLVSLDNTVFASSIHIGFNRRHHWYLWRNDFTIILYCFCKKWWHPPWSLATDTTNSIYCWHRRLKFLPLTAAPSGDRPYLWRTMLPPAPISTVSICCHFLQPPLPLDPETIVNISTINRIRHCRRVHSNVPAPVATPRLPYYERGCCHCHTCIASATFLKAGQ